VPCITLTVTPGLGPVVKVAVMVSAPRSQALRAAGQVVPQPQIGLFLVDTGASHTVVDSGLIAPLGLTPTGVVPMHTPSTAGVPQNCNQFDVGLYIGPPGPGSAGHLLDALPITESVLSVQGIQGLIGRDVLSSCVFIYSGVNDGFTLAY
jgi:hypothetical protein